MTTEHDPRTRTVLSWLREDTHENAERVLLRALDEVDATPQRWSAWPARRFIQMNKVLMTASAAAAVLVVAIVGYNLLPGIAGPGDQPTPRPTPSAGPSSTPTAIANPLVGTWLAPEMTCAQQVATILAAGYTADQIAAARVDLVAQGYGEDGFFDCANQASAARTTNRYSIVFDGLPLAASVLSARIYDDEALASPHDYRVVASTLELGGYQGAAWEYCLTFRYTIDGDRLTLDMIQPSCTGTADAALLDQIALTAMLETASFTRQP